MSEKTKLTVDDCLRAAFQAILKGDTKTRDDLCNLAEKSFNGHDVVTGDTEVPIGKGSTKN